MIFHLTKIFGIVTICGLNKDAFESSIIFKEWAFSSQKCG